MMRKVKNLALLLAGFVWLALGSTETIAQGQSFDTTAPEAILVDARAGTVFFDKKADDLIEPASTSKLMTIVMIFDALKSGRLNLDQEFHISENAWRHGGASSGGSTMYAELNSDVKLSDLLQGIIVQSANDA